MKPRAAPVHSKATTTVLCNCNLLKSEVVHNVYVHATFDKFYPSSVTNCHTSRTPPLKHVTFSTYKLAIAKYNLNFKFDFFFNFYNFQFLFDNMYNILNY